jgi:S-adenosylmethionine:tRNA ribosyltransferase-isomerase
MRLADFDYNLPDELIAQYPSKQRHKCRLMVLNRSNRSISHKTFDQITEYFNKGDSLILNNTKVIPARLFGKRKTGGKVEIFVLDKKGLICEALLRPSNRLKDGETVLLESGDTVEILNRAEIGRLVRFNRPLESILKSIGHIPLPPYITRMDEPSDKTNYQTVYAYEEGATASPTAGLHFTKELLGKIQKKGVNVSYLTLHTSYGTFAPIKSEEIETHKMHKEYFRLPDKTIAAIVECKKNNGAIFATGTTTTRVLEHYSSNGTATLGYTDLFIYPGYRFKTVDHLITNFHLPKSTLLLLVSAFTGMDFILEAYRKAIELRYRFYSYGDAMLIL